MAKILIVADAKAVVDEVRAVVDRAGNELVVVTTGEHVRSAATADPPDLVISDSQVQNMGGIAVCYDLKLEASGGRLPDIPILLLLDRRADVFLANRSGAEGYLVKPLDPVRLRNAVESLLDDGTFYDESFRPLTATYP